MPYTVGEQQQILCETLLEKGVVIVSSEFRRQIGSTVQTSLRFKDPTFPVRIVRETTYQAWLDHLRPDAPGRSEAKPTGYYYYEVEALD